MAMWTTIIFISTLTQQWGKGCYSYAVLYLFLPDTGDCECVLAFEEKKKQNNRRKNPNSLQETEISGDFIPSLFSFPPV